MNLTGTSFKLKSLAVTPKIGGGKTNGQVTPQRVYANKLKILTPLKKANIKTSRRQNAQSKSPYPSINFGGQFSSTLVELIDNSKQSLDQSLLKLQKRGNEDTSTFSPA